MKKKKNEKKLARMQVIEQHREGEKQRWKDFSAKVIIIHSYINYYILNLLFSLQSQKVEC